MSVYGVFFGGRVGGGVVLGWDGRCARGRGGVPSGRIHYRPRRPPQKPAPTTPTPGHPTQTDRHKDNTRTGETDPHRQTESQTDPERQTHTDRQRAKQTRREDKTAHQRDERTPTDTDTHGHQDRAADGQKRHPKRDTRDPRTQKPPPPAELIALR